jgi:glycine/D-amino acid oxidase-like deaminating enzyme
VEQLRKMVIDCDTIVIGAGLAGLNCARRLAASGLDVMVLEASEVTDTQSAGRLVRLGCGALGAPANVPDCRRVAGHGTALDAGARPADPGPSGAICVW